jgi:hypothetical protein
VVLWKVMFSVAGRLFLLFLLGVDWVADPSQLAPGLEALAAPMASTECYCPSLAHRQAVRAQSAPALKPTFVAPATSEDAAPRSVGIRPPPFPAPTATVSLIYLFLSILR